MLDYVIRNVSILDGTGNAAVHGDVGALHPAQHGGEAHVRE